MYYVSVYFKIGKKLQNYTHLIISRVCFSAVGMKPTITIVTTNPLTSESFNMAHRAIIFFPVSFLV